MLKASNTFERWAARLPEKIRKQANFAGMQALNQAAELTRTATYRDIGYTFDRPTPWVASRSIRIDYAKRGGPLQANVYVDGYFKTNKKGRGPLNTLKPHMDGGRRATKGFESLLQRYHVLRPGWFAVAGSGADRLGAVDSYGNIKGSFLVMLISYFNAFPEVGYKANATDKSRARRAKVGKTAEGYKTVRGVQFFVSRPDERVGARSWRNGRRNHLRPGVWAKTGIHGSDVFPVLMFVTEADYRKRMSIPDNGRAAMADDFPRLFRERFHNAMATAR